VFRAGGVESVVPAGSVMVPADIFMAQIINSAVDDRPIYYAMTTAAYENLKLYPFLIRQGVAYKLNNGAPQEDPARGIRRVPTELLPQQLGNLIGPFIDVPRTEKLVSEVFVHSAGFPDEWGHWVDSATDGIPAYYGYTHLGLAATYMSLGDTVQSRTHQEQTERFLRLANVRTEAVAAANR
jgi:hypothetical protein